MKSKEFEFERNHSMTDDDNLLKPEISNLILPNNLGFYQTSAVTTSAYHVYQ